MDDSADTLIFSKILWILKVRLTERANYQNKNIAIILEKGHNYINNPCCLPRGKNVFGLLVLS